jgi:hypothetical protein
MSALTVRTPEVIAAFKSYFFPSGDLNHSAIDAAMANAKKIELFAHHMRFDNVILLDDAFKLNASMMPKDYKNCLIIGENHEKFEACRTVLLKASQKLKDIEAKAQAASKAAEAARQVKEVGLKQMAAASSKLNISVKLSAVLAAQEQKLNAEISDDERALAAMMAQLELMKEQKAAPGAAGNHKAMSPKQAVGVPAAGHHKQQLVNAKAGSPLKPAAAVQSIPASAAGKPVVPAKPAAPASGPHKVASN